MSTPYGKNIIRDANVKGVVFHTPLTADIPKQPPGAKKTLMEEQFYHGLVKGHQQGYEAGRNEGHEIGFKEGVESLKIDLELSLEALKAVLNEFKIKQENLFEHAKPELIRFCLAICESVLREELTNPEKFAHMLEQLLQTAKSISKDISVQVFISPADLTRLKKYLEDVSDSHEEIRRLEFIADPDIEVGNCKLKSSLGLVNFDIARILKGIEQKTLEA